MKIEVKLDTFQKERFMVWLSGEDLSFVINPSSIYLTLDAQQIDKLGFECSTALQDSERKSLDKTEKL